MTKKEQEHLYNIQNVPIDEETLRNQRMESNYETKRQEICV